MILITGSSGFIGTATVRRLQQTGEKVRAVDTAPPKEQLPGVEYVQTTTPYDFSGVLTGVSSVIHLAAKVGIEVSHTDAPLYIANNTLLTANLLSAMVEASVRKIVLASSMVVYGDGSYLCPQHCTDFTPVRTISNLKSGLFDPTCSVCASPLKATSTLETSPLSPHSVYALSKLQQEQLVEHFARTHGFSAALLRYHNVYGPLMPKDTPYAGVAAIWRSALLNGKAPQVFEDGEQRRDFVHVDDIARANVKALTYVKAHTTNARAFNISSGQVSSIKEVASLLAQTLHGPDPVITGQFRQEDVRHVFASPHRAEKELGFKAKISLQAGLTAFGEEV